MKKCVRKTSKYKYYKTCSKNYYSYTNTHALTMTNACSLATLEFNFTLVLRGLNTHLHTEYTFRIWEAAP